MSQSEIRMCAGIGKSQNEYIVLNLVDKHPIIFDVAITKSDKIAGKRMVAVLCRQRFAHSKLIDNIKKLRTGFAALLHQFDALFEASGRFDCVFHENRNSSSFAGSSQYGAFGSLATSLASRIAANRRSRLLWREILKGISPVARHFLKKQVMAVVIFMPISSKKSSASALRESSIRIVSEVVIAKNLSFVKTECIVSKNECKRNAA